MEAELSNTTTPAKPFGERVDSATSTAHQAINKAAEAARPAVDRVASGAHNTVDKLAGAAVTTAETMRVRGEQLKDAQVRATESCRGYVRENPLVSVGIAAAVGFVLSRLIRRF
jgi:ElaB/YqjD/DUF883 family membrane-anchored ribosome-binding protein